MHEPLKSEISFPCSSVVFLDVFPIVFQSQVFCGLTYLVHVLRVGIPDVELESVAPQGKVP